MYYEFFKHSDCEYYPCHKSSEDLNCLFCFCPLYSKQNCPGSFRILENGIKDCSSCDWCHKKENYNSLISILQGNKLQLLNSNFNY